MTGDKVVNQIFPQLCASSLRSIELQVSASQRLAWERDACVLKNREFLCCQFGWEIFSPQFVRAGSFLENEQVSPFVAHGE